jgi:phosphoribosylformylglycinamidine synthase
MKNINVLAFPGTNCQTETARALREAGFASRIMKWNDDPQEIYESDGIVIAGGFSFEDRGRSGVIAAADPVAEVLKKMAAEGKPLLGICNGAQVLVEIGLVPGINGVRLDSALARNRRQDETGILGSGYFHDFVHVKPTGIKGAWASFDGVLKMPIAHGEGRFTVTDEVLEQIKEKKLNCLTYCDAEGNIDEHFPINPNGSVLGMAALCNEQGNVMAMMPHPERSKDSPSFFSALHGFFERKTESTTTSNCDDTTVAEGAEKTDYDIELFVQLKITDNAEKTIEKTAKRIFKDDRISLERRLFWGIMTTGDTMELAKKLVAADEFHNPNKETLHAKINGNFYKANGKNLEETSNPLLQNTFYAFERDDIVGEEKTELLQKHLGIHAKVRFGVAWSVAEGPIETLEKSNLFANPVSWEVAV